MFEAPVIGGFMTGYTYLDDFHVRREKNEATHSVMEV